MKVLNLRCTYDHGFEGWFASEADYQSQSERGLIECPVCGDKDIAKLPAAPRLNVSRTREAAADTGTAPSVPAGPSQAMTLQSMWMRAVRHVIENTVDVGDRFAEEARRIHYGEAQERPIRGQATPEDAQALKDEGIEVMALPVPAAIKGSIQ